MTTLAAEARCLLSAIEGAPRRGFGQHFMVSQAALNAVCDALSPKPGETVMEIGPGLGFLTRELLSRGARVTAVEKDRKFAAHLKDLFKGEAFSVALADVLKTEPAATRVVGNIPYNITSPVLEWLILNRARVREAVLTVQFEVARRLTASPGTKEWGALSVFVQTYTQPRLVRKIPRSVFWPSPKVDSAVLHLNISEKPLLPINDEALYFTLVRRAFQQRRKTLLNALSGKGDKRQAAAALKRSGIDAGRRPETLTLAEWSALSAAWFASGAV